jgi:hypothetical protein
MSFAHLTSTAMSAGLTFSKAPVPTKRMFLVLMLTSVKLISFFTLINRYGRTIQQWK